MPAIIPAIDSLIDETDSAVKLASYAQIVGLSENGFFGLRVDSEIVGDCHPIWTLRERAMIARYLKEAQQEMEQITRFPLTPRWIEDESRYAGFPVHAEWNKIIEAGFRNTATIQLNAVVSHATDPAVIVAATVYTDESEIAVFHPGTDIEIYPSSISISGGNVTIEIPRARLVKESAQDNPADGSDYTILPPNAASVFESVVDVKRVYNDISVQGGLKWLHQGSTCVCPICQNRCETYTQQACITVRNGETGALDLSPAGYFATGWAASCDCYCQEPDLVILNYRAGVTPTEQIQDAVIRLAHSKMATPPCGCGIAQSTWTRDRHIPEALSSEQASCPFGQSDGAFWAYKQAVQIAIVRGTAY